MRSELGARGGLWAARGGAGGLAARARRSPGTRGENACYVVLAVLFNERVSARRRHRPSRPPSLPASLRAGGQHPCPHGEAAWCTPRGPSRAR
uniref:Uncharacterized protein n=1 Tax=Dromaius novaehollandiae TaxID=8790 RepID=A0A8C4JM20_DRONO